MNLNSGRLKDAGILAEVLGRASERDLDATRALVRAESPLDYSDLESLIHLGKLEFGDQTQAS